MDGGSVADTVLPRAARSSAGLRRESLGRAPATAARQGHRCPRGSARGAWPAPPCVQGLSGATQGTHVRAHPRSRPSSPTWRLPVPVLFPREGRTSHTTSSAFLMEPAERPCIPPSPWLQCPLHPGSLSWGHCTPASDTHPGSGTRRWEHKSTSRGTQDVLPTLWSLAGERAEGCHSQQPQLVPQSRSQPLLQLRVHLGPCLLLAQGPAEELGPGQTRWRQHNRVARGSQRLPQLPGIFLAWLRAPL